MKRITLRTGMLVFGLSALCWTAPASVQAYFRGGCCRVGCWGWGGPVVGIGFYGGYPGWYGYPCPYPYGYPMAPYPPGVAATVPAAPIRVTVHVPSDAEVWFNGNQTQQKGAVRQFMTPPVAAEGKYEVRAAWRIDGQLVIKSRTVAVGPGMNVDIDFLNMGSMAQASPVSEEDIPSVFLPTAANQRLGPASTPITLSAASSPVAQEDAIEKNLRQLSSPDAAIRQKAVMDLGRSDSARAVAPLTAVLAGDASPQVRDAAARALGLIADAHCLPGLIRAAQADDDREVRHSAQFAVEVIRSRLRQN